MIVQSLKQPIFVNAQDDSFVQCVSPTLNEIVNLIQANTKRCVEAIPFLLPYDLSDLFAAAAWRRPELYLQPEVRAGISSFAVANRSLIELGVKSLEADLRSGQWDAKYGEIRSLTEIDMGYRFLRATIETYNG